MHDTQTIFEQGRESQVGGQENRSEEELGEGKNLLSSKEKENASKRRYREKNRSKIRSNAREYARRKRSDPSFREEENAKQRQRRANDPTWRDRSNAYVAQRMNDPEFRNRRYDYSRKYMADYREQPNIKERQKSYFKNRLENDVFFRLRLNLSSRVRIAVKKQLGNKARKTMHLIGCTISHLRDHLESKFEPWMTWDNYGMGEGKWVIDHIRPCISFDLTKEDQQLLCFHWTNLQPLSWRKNSEKRAKYTPEIQSDL